MEPSEHLPEGLWSRIWRVRVCWGCKFTDDPQNNLNPLRYSHEYFTSSCVSYYNLRRKSLFHCSIIRKYFRRNGTNFCFPFASAPANENSSPSNNLSSHWTSRLEPGILCFSQMGVKGVYAWKRSSKRLRNNVWPNLRFSTMWQTANATHTRLLGFIKIFIMSRKLQNHHLELGDSGGTA